ncbi:hypothetical protein [Halobacillus salinus]|uniref:hypothetical protein n=1 Tax=Halobacillus salinus TaxID=192814 RepID=UPI001591B2CF|nr:hypothetical protein [Halobacillus salinus]
MPWLFLLLFAVGFSVLFFITKKFTVKRSLTKEGAIYFAIATFLLFILTVGIVAFLPS